MKDEVFTTCNTVAEKAGAFALPRDKEYMGGVAPHASAQAWPRHDRRAVSGHARQEGLEYDIIDGDDDQRSFCLRDAAIFQVFRTVPTSRALLTATSPSKRCDIWVSGPCSSGQEPYSIAMILEEEKASRRRDRRYGRGRYSAEIDPTLREGSLYPLRGAAWLADSNSGEILAKEEKGWRIKAPLRDADQIQKNFNCLESFGGLGTFDSSFAATSHSTSPCRRARHSRATLSRPASH